MSRRRHEKRVRKKSGLSQKQLRVNESMGIKEWNLLIKSNIESAIGSVLDGEFTAANYPAGFNYAVKQQYYNADTLSTLNTLVVEKDGISILEGSYSSLYKNVIENLEYAFSVADQQLMQQEENKQAVLVGKIIDEYKESGLDEEVQDYPNIIYIMKRIKEITGMDYLNVNIREYPSLAILCRNLSEYARIGINTVKFENAWSKAEDRLMAISKNIENPSIENGGIKTDLKTCVVGWDKLPETEQIIEKLKQETRIEISLELSTIKENLVQISFDSQVHVVVPFFWFMAVEKNKSRYDFSKYANEQSCMTISIVFEGITTIAAIPTPLTDNNIKGWFAYDILTEAAEKSGKNSTGYQLHGSKYDPSNLFGEKGKLKRMKTLVISQNPEIKLHMEKFKCEEIQKLFETKNNVFISILGGLINCEINNTHSVSEYSYDEKLQMLDVTIKPAPIESAGAISKQTAYVLGGVTEIL